MRAQNNFILMLFVRYYKCIRDHYPCTIFTKYNFPGFFQQCYFNCITQEIIELQASSRAWFCPYQQCSPVIGIVSGDCLLFCDCSPFLQSWEEKNLSRKKRNQRYSFSKSIFILKKKRSSSLFTHILYLTNPVQPGLFYKQLCH